MRGQRNQLLALFLGALVIRVSLLAFGPWIDPQRAMHPDSPRYLELAHNLREHSRFAVGPERVLSIKAVAEVRQANGTLPAADEHGLRPDSYRTPGYPAFLAAVFAFFDNVRTVLVIQCVLGSLLALGAFTVARAFGLPDRAALLIGAVWAFHPALVVFDVYLMSETLFNSCMTLALVLLAARPVSPTTASASGLVLGFGTLVRPMGLLYLPPALVLLWLRKKGTPRLPAAALLVATAVIPPAAWAARNYAGGEGLRVSSIVEQQLLFRSGAYVLSEERGQVGVPDWPTRAAELKTLLLASVEPGDDVYAASRTLGLHMMLDRPVEAIRIHVRSLARLVLSHSMKDLFEVVGSRYPETGLFSRFAMGESSQSRISSVPALTAAIAWTAINMAIATLALIGAVVAVMRRNWWLLLAWGAPVVLFAISAGPVGSERLRLPMMLPMFMLATSALLDRVWITGPWNARARREIPAVSPPVPVIREKEDDESTRLVCQ